VIFSPQPNPSHSPQQPFITNSSAIGAIECLQAAVDLGQGFPDLTWEYIQKFLAIELGLKAFLVSRDRLA